ncbi:hypothetical protein VOLCADRAFT_119446 [Volvox carteri f. nagariensis]|uniref:Uncharacterized protein n=1 Tax=Volvox carteri f. nagariensis TaxID=3068 RepID=D8UD73_VOLCA|nr:uncharacterized protein VOLCADRAFT_119446 [Volvox carteri f. nagariensis]EFJ42382.1 hypothetical protein VOLCADRAFT_119446 [Volvox carteri f. nagariensis]|eukprot:XP_002956615.1 hypothetical protein VOLCADRAFT_119446 [Volvox carteri f. nagariensis]
MSLRCGKKRKLIVDHEAEKSIYGSFVSAANAVSTLYSQAVQQQRRASAQASRQALERVVTFLLAQNPGSEMVSKAVLLNFLQQEYESIEGGEHLPHVFPAPQLSVVGPGPPAGELQPDHSGFTSKAMRGVGGYCGASGVSPSRRQHSGGMDGMDASDGATQPLVEPQPPAQQELHGFGPFPSGPAFPPHIG